jgi:hypothetical protein
MTSVNSASCAENNFEYGKNGMVRISWLVMTSGVD